MHARTPIRRPHPVAAVLLSAALAAPLAAQKPSSTSFTIEQVTSYPFPSELAVAANGARIAWAFNEQGKRNIWVAEGPDWKARKLTAYDRDDGQELTFVSVTPDGKFVIYVRGGDHDSNWQAEGNLAPNPLSSPQPPKVQISSVSFAGGEPKLLAEGDEPRVSATGVVAFVRDRQIWTVPEDGSAPAKRLFFARGDNGDATWSPDGSRLAFVSRRGDHSFIGVFANDTTPILWLAPSTNRDGSPEWSPDGTRIAFVRTAGSGGVPQALLEQHPRPWSIWTADARTGEGRRVWNSPATLRGSYPTTQGQANLHWGAGDRLVFLADLDGWPHLYSVPLAGGEPTLLTPGRGMAEYISLSPDRRFLVFAGNMGKAPEDIDRRHIYKVAVDKPGVVEITPGEGIEFSPFVTGDGRSIAFIGGGPRKPPLPMIAPVDGGKAVAIGEDRIPADFPTAALVVPKMVVFKASDGTEVHGQLFERPGGAAKKPAVVFVHGGPPRQMLLGWHYMDYYTNGYAMNQYLASRGYVVLSVNYRLGIGYGHEFHHADKAGPWGASEYLDTRAGGEYLKALPQVDPKRIGIWGGSYGGFLTAMALAHDSQLFAAGVDLHGVHDWTAERARGITGADSYEKAPDAPAALETAWKSGPDAFVSQWTSPVLLIQGDDDRNVRFHQTVDLARRLEAQGVKFEELVLPDEIHGFLRHASWLKADGATAAFFDKQFGVGGRTAADSR
ncbi:MAG TPA: prolyl oligopeptidase family serine peptidase [Longimicrobiales bacterium]|nr:prolyl oligopeptidase family serine peptidase [Longimicrobiales bacterium]